MKIKINDKIEDIPDGISLAEILSRKGLDRMRGVVITLNGEVVNKEDFEKTALNENDDVKIYSFVQGG